MKLRHGFVSALMACLVCAMPANAQTPVEDVHILNLTDVEISTLIEDVSMITGYTFIVHPDVRANVTVNSQDPMSTQEVFQVFLSTLRVNGYTAVPTGRGVYRIVPEAVAVFDADARSRQDNAFVTEVFRLDHFNAVEAARMIQPLLGAQGQVTASPSSNALIVVEYGSSLGRIRSLINEIDEDRSVTHTIHLKAIQAGEMQEILSELQGSGSAEGGNRGRTPFSAIAVEASNSIVLKGEPSAIQRASELVYELDQNSGLRRETRVVRLSHADAATIEPILRQIADTEAAVEGPSAGPAASIALHEPSNALVISAAPTTLAAFTHVISELDARRKQVLVEAIIVEVSDTAARELGLQFLVAGQDGDVPFASSTFSNSAPNLLALTGALAGGDLSDQFGDSGVDLIQQAAVSSLLGVTGGTVGFGGETGDTLFSVVLNALETDTESNVLSTPSVLALDNQEAFVSVGQEIPISSGQVLGDANLNPFQTTERREIGVILNVTPRIGQDNTIRLDIDQEVSSIASTIGVVTPDFILNQSQLQTSVIADNGELIVLGGLIQVEDVVNLEQVPILGEIPGLGRLFQSEEKSRASSNLMVFIRPTIVADVDDAAAETARTYNYIRAQQIIANDGGPSSLDQFFGEVFEGNTPEDFGEGAEKVEAPSE